MTGKHFLRFTIMVGMISWAQASPAREPSSLSAQSVDHVFWKQVDLSARAGAATESANGVEVTLQSSIGADPSDEEVLASIRMPGAVPAIVRLGEGSGEYPVSIGIGRLSASDEFPSVLLQTFTGGAHCCAAIKLGVPIAGRLHTVDFPEVDGEGLSSFPKDVDGDIPCTSSVAAIVRFVPTFCAGCFSKPFEHRSKTRLS